jgi:hypothetical protein
VRRQARPSYTPHVRAGDVRGGRHGRCRAAAVGSDYGQPCAGTARTTRTRAHGRTTRVCLPLRCSGSQPPITTSVSCGRMRGTHARTHARMHARARVSTETGSHMHARTCICVSLHARATHAHLRTCACPFMHAYALARTHTCACARVRRAGCSCLARRTSLWMARRSHGPRAAWSGGACR